MRVRVDQQLCQGHTLCAMTAPDVFHIGDDDGRAYVDNESVAAGQESEVADAAAGCPEMAVLIESD